MCVCVSIWEKEERGKEEENDKQIEPSVNLAKEYMEIPHSNLRKLEIISKEKWTHTLHPNLTPEIYYFLPTKLTRMRCILLFAYLFHSVTQQTFAKHVPSAQRGLHVRMD